MGQAAQGGSPAKPSVPALEDGGADCRPHEELRGMLTIVIANANPGATRPAPP